MKIYKHWYFSVCASLRYGQRVIVFHDSSTLYLHQYRKDLKPCYTGPVLSTGSVLEVNLQLKQCAETKTWRGLQNKTGGNRHGQANSVAVPSKLLCKVLPRFIYQWILNVNGCKIRWREVKYSCQHSEALVYWTIPKRAISELEEHEYILKLCCQSFNTALLWF